MGVSSILHGGGVAEIVLDHPPVNALPAAGWQALADELRRAGAEARAVVLRAEGRGFCAGVDIKELQAGDPAQIPSGRPDAAYGGIPNGHRQLALLAVNRACAAAFAAVYECEVPVVVAVHGFCLGGGVGLAGNADLLIASSDATFGLPEVDRGALGAATHLSRLVPQQRLRYMVYTCQPATADELHGYGSVLSVVPRAELRDAAMAVAERIAAKETVVVRAAKQSLNGIDPMDVRKSYRFEQGFTFELDLQGAGDRARSAFLTKKP